MLWEVGQLRAGDLLVLRNGVDGHLAHDLFCGAPALLAVMGAGVSSPPPPACPAHEEFGADSHAQVFVTSGQRYHPRSMLGKN